jgi:Ca2+-binding EF-hand superfamily protein
MKSVLIHSFAVACLGYLSASCGAADKIAAAETQLSALQETFKSFDLTCDFSQISGASATEATQSLHSANPAEEVSSTCSNISEQYAMLVKEYDVDGDGKLSTDELAEAEAEWNEAQLESMDDDDDGKVSNAEKSKWRQDKLPARKDKISENFKDACSSLGKGESDCKKLYDVQKANFKEEFKKRMADFDTDKDGKLSEAEKASADALLAKERKERYTQNVKGKDKDGDGKLDGSERSERRTERRDSRPPVQSKPSPVPGQGQGQGQGPK